MHQMEVTGHIYSYHPVTLWAAGVVHILPFGQQWVDFVPILPALQAQRGSKGVSAKSPVEIRRWH